MSILKEKEKQYVIFGSKKGKIIVFLPTEGLFGDIILQIGFTFFF
jgi:hypothetical protein